MDAPIEQRESPYEILRRMENTVRLGSIVEVRHGDARCRVRMGNLTSNWLPWLAQRAGASGGNHWWPPVVGEQCLVLAPGGDLLQAVALPGVYSDAKPQASSDRRVCRTDWSDADYMEHNSEFSELTVNCYGSIALKVMSSSIKISEHEVRIEAGGGLLIVDKNGVTATPDIKAHGISLVNHLHGGVEPGGDLSGRPQ